MQQPSLAGASSPSVNDTAFLPPRGGGGGLERGFAFSRNRRRSAATALRRRGLRRRQGEGFAESTQFLLCGKRSLAERLPETSIEVQGGRDASGAGISRDCAQSSSLGLHRAPVRVAISTKPSLSTSTAIPRVRRRLSRKARRPSPHCEQRARRGSRQHTQLQQGVPRATNNKRQKRLLFHAKFASS